MDLSLHSSQHVSGLLPTTGVGRRQYKRCDIISFSGGRSKRTHIKILCEMFVYCPIEMFILRHSFCMTIYGPMWSSSVTFNITWPWLAS